MTTETDLLAQYYHLVFTSNDKPLIQQLLNLTGGPLMDLGCATGRTLEYADSMGLEGIGIDHSESMVAEGRRRHHDRPRIQFIKSEMAEAHSQFFGKIGLVVMPENTYSMLLMPQDRLQVLSLVKKYLKPNGLFYLAVRNDNPESDLSRSFTIKTESHEDLKFELVQTEDWAKSLRKYDLRFVLNDRKNEYHFLTRITPFETLVKEFGEAGFKVERVFGDENGSPFERTKTRWHFVLSVGPT